MHVGLPACYKTTIEYAHFSARLSTLRWWCVFLCSAHPRWCYCCVMWARAERGPAWCRAATCWGINQAAKVKVWLMLAGILIYYVWLVPASQAPLTLFSPFTKKWNYPRRRKPKGCFSMHNNAIHIYWKAPWKKLNIIRLIDGNHIFEVAPSINQ